MSANTLQASNVRITSVSHFELRLGGVSSRPVSLSLPKGIITETLRLAFPGSPARRVAEAGSIVLTVKKLPGGAFRLQLGNGPPGSQPLARCTACGHTASVETQAEAPAQDAASAREFLLAIAQHVTARQQTFAVPSAAWPLVALPHAGMRMTPAAALAALHSALDISTFAPNSTKQSAAARRTHVSMDQHYRSFFHFNAKLVSRLQRINGAGAALHEARGALLNAAHALNAFVATKPAGLTASQAATQAVPPLMHADTMAVIIPCPRHARQMATIAADIARAERAPSTRLSWRSCHGVHKTPLYTVAERGDRAACGLVCASADPGLIIVGRVKCNHCRLAQYTDTAHAEAGFAAAMPNASALYAALAARFCAAHAIAAPHPALARSLPAYLDTALDQHAPASAPLTDVERDTLQSLTTKPSCALYSLWLAHGGVHKELA